ncbi:MAG: hypothetical protein ACI9R3_005167 [Verrucomicrobiales bacterium]|jgi:hypothetical protein
MLADLAAFMDTRHKEPVSQTKSHFMNVHSLPAAWKWHVTHDYEAGGPLREEMMKCLFAFEAAKVLTF